MRILRRARSRHLLGAIATLVVLGATQVTVAGSHDSRLRTFSMVRTRARVVALTFDDGPDGEFTPRVLALLKKYGARATFFVTGSRAMARPDLIADEVVAGEIANHTWDHADLSRISARAGLGEIQATDVALTSLVGKNPLYFRAPFDHLPHATFEQTGHQVVRWSLAVDRFRRMPLNAAAQAIIDRLHPGSIILAHDSCPPRDSRGWCLHVRNRSLQVLERVLERLSARGWRVVTVSELRALHSR